MVEAIEMQEDFKQTEVGVIPSNWEVRPIDEITSLMTNGFVGTVKTHYTDFDNGILYIQGYNIEENAFNFNGIKRVTHEFHKQHLKSCLQEGDLLTIQTGDIGVTTVVPKELEGANCHALIITRFKKGTADPKFYSYYFNFSEGRKRLKEIETGSTMKHINVGDMIQMLIPYPTKTEQTAIATALNNADALITQLEQLIAKKRAIKQGAMQELLKPKEGWEEKKLWEECELITKGTTPTSVGRNFQSSGINFIKIESLTENGKIIKDKVGFIDSYTNSLLKRSQLKSGDTLFSIAGALGRVAIVSNQILPANTNQALAIIRLKNDTEIDLKYLFYFLNSRKIQTLILAINVQGAQANLSLQNISNLPIKYPLRTEQTHIAQTLSDMDAEIEALENKLNKYKMIKQGMMQNLLTGRIRLV